MMAVYACKAFGPAYVPSEPCEPTRSRKGRPTSTGFGTWRVRSTKARSNLRFDGSEGQGLRKVAWPPQPGFSTASITLGTRRLISDHLDISCARAPSKGAKVQALRSTVPVECVKVTRGSNPQC